MRNLWKDGILGVVVGDALGCPVQFESRREVATHPVTDMRGYGTFNLPEGSWTDDSSLTIALLSSLYNRKQVELHDIMNNFVDWLVRGKFTPYGYSYDIGKGTMDAINDYRLDEDPYSCGGRGENNNGNGSLMRIMPIVLFEALNNVPVRYAVANIDKVSALTHAHARAKTACGIYYFLANRIIKDGAKLPLNECLKLGMIDAFSYYNDNPEMRYYSRFDDLSIFKECPEKDIRSSGYVVDSIEAAVWCLLNSSSYKECTLKAVNLGGDTDTIAAIAGGLAGLYYAIGGKNGIPEDWIEKIKKKDSIIALCNKMNGE